MKQLINRTQKLTLYVCFLLFIVSSAYRVAFTFILRDISALNFTYHYQFIQFMLARPVFFITLSALASTAFLLWADKTISKKRKEQCLTLFIILLVAYILLFIIALNGWGPDYLFLILLNPAIQILLGLLLSITIPKNKQNTRELQTES